MLEATEILKRAIEENVIHGFALAVGKRDKVLCRAVGGTLGGADSPPVTEKTRYDLDALTQLMVTTPLLMLALEKGRLSLSDPLSLYVKAPQDKRGITLWQLLTHMGGLEPSFLLEQETENDEDGLRVLLSRPLDSLAGKRVRYSGMGFLLLGKILEKVYGMPLDAAAKKNIFSPLGLKHTGYLPTGEDIAYTETDTLTGQPRIGLADDENTRFFHGVSGNAGLFSDLEDCSRYLTMLTSEGKLEGKAFLTKEAVRLISADHTKGMKESRGLCVQIAGRDHTFMGDLWPKLGYGLTGATGTSFAADPTGGLYVVMLTNRVQTAHEGRAFLRLERLLHNSVHAGVLRAEEES